MAQVSAKPSAPEIPWIPGIFRHVLRPPGMPRDEPGKTIDQWYVNDHCVMVNNDQKLHWFGITNPYPANGDLYGPGSHRHIGHAVADHPFGPWEAREHAMALPADTTQNIGACFVVPWQDEYRMIFGYNTGFRFARSTDLDHWQEITAEVLFLGPGTRDPCVLRLDDGTYLLYGAATHEKGSAVVLATSRDLTHWQQEKPALQSQVITVRDHGALESPFVHRRGDDYYLFVNFSHRQYAETLVFHSKNPYRFDWASPLCTTYTHAAEIFTWGGKTYITHCGIEDRHWDDIRAPYGLYLAELAWLPYRT